MLRENSVNPNNFFLRFKFSCFNNYNSEFLLLFLSNTEVITRVIFYVVFNNYSCYSL